MILIFSQHSREYTTDLVIDWLDYKKASYTRANGNDFMNQSSFSISYEREDHIQLQLDNENDIDLSEINVLWFRRWLPYNHLVIAYSDITDRLKFNMQLAKTLRHEMFTLRSHIFNELKDRPWLSFGNNVSVNKLEVLKVAQKHDLRIPATLVTNNKKDVIKFTEKHDGVIVKPIDEACMLIYRNIPFIGYTAKLTDEVLQRIPSTFFPSLFQEQIEKRYELRIFYFNGEFYSLAIFSQNDQQTAVDFRVYNLDKPNRTTPFKIPVELEKKLDALMKELDLDNGSIDVIRSTSGEWVFLEVNPVGQFGMVSGPCNYHLEERVADYLIEQDHS